MKPVLILYATREGHTQRIAEHIGATLRARGLAAELHDVAALRDLRAPVDFGGYSAAILAASVHMNRHEPEMIRFVEDHRAELDRMPTAFLSVSMAEAGAEDPAANEARHAEALSEVEEALDKFFHQTGWHPVHVKAVAGALMYTKYGRFTRLLMKMIAKRAGQATDTSRDHVYTDWAALDRFVDELAGELTPAGTGVAA